MGQIGRSRLAVVGSALWLFACAGYDGPRIGSTGPGALGGRGGAAGGSGGTAGGSGGASSGGGGSIAGLGGSGSGGAGALACRTQNVSCAEHPCCDGFSCEDGKHAGVDSKAVCTSRCTDTHDCPHLSFATLFCVEGICSAASCVAGDTICEDTWLLTCNGNFGAITDCVEYCATTSQRFYQGCGPDPVTKKDACLCTALQPGE